MCLYPLQNQSPKLCGVKTLSHLCQGTVSQCFLLCPSYAAFYGLSCPLHFQILSNFHVLIFIFY